MTASRPFFFPILIGEKTTRLSVVSGMALSTKVPINLSTGDSWNVAKTWGAGLQGNAQISGMGISVSVYLLPQIGFSYSLAPQVGYDLTGGGFVEGRY